MRSLNERCHFKANEWRTLAFYVIVPALNDLLKSKYLNNLIKYVLFLRILCDNKISQDDLDNATKIMDLFITEFQELYSSDNMKFNIHSHLHLVSQVKRFGPLNKCSCFPFENMFRITRSMFHGTRNHEGQIGRNLVVSKNVRSEISKLNKTTQNHLIINYLNGVVLKEKPVINSLINSKVIELKNLESFEIPFLNDFNLEIIHISNIAIINYITYHTISYSLKYNNYNCYTLEYRNNNSVEYGIRAKN